MLLTSNSMWGFVSLVNNPKINNLNGAFTYPKDLALSSCWSEAEVLPENSSTTGDLLTTDSLKL